MKHTPLLTLLVALLLTGCATEKIPILNTGTTKPSSVQDVLDQAVPTAPEVTAPPAAIVETAPVPEGFGSFDSVDIDLTTMNAIMVYTQVYDMISNPQNYLGKTVKMHGTFGSYYEESVDTYYFALIIEDATACCAQGIEFMMADDETRAFPDGYPAEGETSTVVGVFNTYFPEELPDFEYCRLENAEFITE